MSTFKTATPETQPLDPYKRMHYSLGLVLGKDDLDQEQTFFLFHDRLHNRALHGYGTICGLDVALEGTEVQVSPGLAVNPRGEVIRVAPAQCADLQAWLSALMAGSDAPEAAPEHVYVVLCYRECETDTVPVPGAPCRTEEETAVPSRIASSFDLKFARELPNAAEDAAVERFAALLRRIEVVVEIPEGGEELTPDNVAAIVEALAEAPAEEDNAAELHVTAENSDAVLETAHRTWVTKVRPVLLPDGKNCSGGPPDEACVLLAEVTFRTEGLTIADDSVTVDDKRRPYLLHTRLIQEGLRGLAGRTRYHRELLGLTDDDHPQYLLVSSNSDPSQRELLHDLPAGGRRIRNLGPAEEVADAVRLDQIIRRDEAAGGDLRLSILAPEVKGLLGRDIRESTLENGEGRYLRFIADEWVLSELEGGGEPDTRPILPFVSIHVRGDFIYEVWFNLDAPENGVALHEDQRTLDDQLTVRLEDAAGPQLTDIQFASERLLRNLYLVRLRPEESITTPCLRFDFSLDAIRLEDGSTLLEYANSGPFRLSGFVPERRTATAFVYDHNIPIG